MAKQSLKMLTLWQPWASFVAMRLKKCETRSWGTNYRGLLAIHAAERPIDATGAQLWYQVTGTHLIDTFMPYGSVVAIAVLTDCLSMTTREEESKLLFPIDVGKKIIIDDIAEEEKRVGVWEAGRVAWLLEDVIAVDPPVKAKGAQGLRNCPDDIADKLAELLCKY